LDVVPVNKQVLVQNILIW